MKFKTYKDGAKWCAVRLTFVNLQESLAGFGDTEDEARADLVRLEDEYYKKLSMSLKRIGALRNYVL